MPILPKGEMRGLQLFVTYKIGQNNDSEGKEKGKTSRKKVSSIPHIEDPNGGFTNVPF